MRIGKRMLGGVALVLALLGMTTVSGVFAADKVFKWVDADGVTHYGEQAPKEAAATKIKVTDTTSSDADDEIARLEKARQAARAPKDPETGESTASTATAATTTDTDDANKKACDQHRKNLEVLKSGRRVRMLDEQGKPRTISAEEVQAQVDLAESELKRCEQLQKVKDARAGAAAPK